MVKFPNGELCKGPFLSLSPHAKASAGHEGIERHPTRWLKYAIVSYLVKGTRQQLWTAARAA
jgi:hypothetical protein